MRVKSLTFYKCAGYKLYAIKLFNLANLYLASQLLSYQEQVDGVRLMHNQCRNVKLSATLSYQEQKRNGMRLQLLATPGI